MFLRLRDLAYKKVSTYKARLHFSHILEELETVSPHVLSSLHLEVEKKDGLAQVD
jgi:hypothetical protein